MSAFNKGVAECLKLCGEVLAELQKEAVNETTVPGDSESSRRSQEFPSKATVGIVLRGASIEEVVIGGPAYNSKKVFKGQTILEVDGVAATADNVSVMMLGNDKGGAQVTLKVTAGGPDKAQTVTMTKVMTADFLKRRRVLQLFEVLKAKVAEENSILGFKLSLKDNPLRLLGGEQSPLALIDGRNAALESDAHDAAALCTATLVADAAHHEQVLANVHRLQAECAAALGRLQEEFDYVTDADSVRACARICADAADAAAQDVLCLQPGVTARSQPGHRSTVGLLIDGVTVTGVVPGGPAAAAGRIAAGDVIVKVDGAAATGANVEELMARNDTPGAPVVVTVAKGGPKGLQVSVAMRRMSLGTVQDRRSIVDLLQDFKKRAGQAPSLLDGVGGFFRRRCCRGPPCRTPWPCRTSPVGSPPSA